MGVKHEHLRISLKTSLLLYTLTCGLCCESESETTFLLSVGGGFNETHTVQFTSASGKSCLTVSLPLPAVHDPLSDTVFSAAIVHQEQLPFDVGQASTASLTVRTLQGF